jgi:hypothetical protein
MGPFLLPCHVSEAFFGRIGGRPLACLSDVIGIDAEPIEAYAQPVCGSKPSDLGVIAIEL